MIVENTELLPAAAHGALSAAPVPPAPTVIEYAPGLINNAFPCKGEGPYPEVLKPPAPPPPPIFPPPAPPAITK